MPMVLGRRLLETCHGLSADVGYLAVIHALMRDPGACLALSRPYSQPNRNYGLFARSLEQPWARGATDSAIAP
jgi:hypothetical protein